MKRFRLFLANIGKRQVEFPIITPPLGIMYLAAYIRSKFNVDIMLVNQKIDNCSNDRLIYKITEFKPDIIGLSVLTPTAHNLPYLTRMLKQIMPRALIVIGGPHVSAFESRSLDHNQADIGVPREGELALEQVIRAHFEGDSFSDVPGIYWRDTDKNIIANPGAIPFIKDIDSLPPPAYDLIDLTPYWKTQSMPPLPTRKYASLFSSRGCPYHCIYCHRIFGDVFRCHSAERIADEMAWLQKRLSIRDFEFLDDIFNLNKKRMADLSELIHTRGIKTKLVFPNGVRTDILNRDEIDLLIDMGMYYASFALESGSPRIQKVIRKNLDIEKYVENVNYAASQGVVANGFAMMGFPTETETDLRMTIDITCRSRLHSISYFTTTPFPNTEMHRLAEKEFPERLQRLIYDDMEYAGLAVNLSDVPDRVLFAYQRRANRKFFLNPARLFRLLKDYPQPYKLPLYLPTFARRALKGIYRPRRS